MPKSSKSPLISNPKKDPSIETGVQSLLDLERRGEIVLGDLVQGVFPPELSSALIPHFRAIYTDRSGSRWMMLSEWLKLTFQASYQVKAAAWERRTRNAKTNTPFTVFEHQVGRLNKLLMPLGIERLSAHEDFQKVMSAVGTMRELLAGQSARELAESREVFKDMPALEQATVVLPQLVFPNKD